MKSERFYLVASGNFSSAAQVNTLNGKTYSSHIEMSRDAQSVLGRGIERSWRILSEHGYQKLLRGNRLLLAGRHVAALTVVEDDQPKIDNYVLVADTCSEISVADVNKLSGQVFSSLADMSGEVEKVLGDFENRWHIFPAEYYRELHNDNQAQECGKHYIAFLYVIERP